MYVEGGGNKNNALAIRCRQGFHEFFSKAGLKGRLPKVVACGGRASAYKDFKTSHENAGKDDISILLVDSEGPVSGKSSWEHVKQQQEDQWHRPAGATDDQLHLMVQAMEAWLHADSVALRAFYGQGFREEALSQRKGVEDIPTTDLTTGLQRATRECQKGPYSKGEHSFQLLALIDPAKIRAASKYADRLLSVLDRLCE